MKCRIEEVIDMVLIKTFKSLAEAQEFINDHSAANEEFVVGCSNGHPAIYCKARRIVYH